LVVSALNTLHDFNPATILPSLRSGNPLVFINPSTPTKPDQTYDLQPGGSGNTPICADKHHGQLNTTLQPTLNKNALTVPFFTGRGAQKREGGAAKVFLRE
jgi:hypothetical protein